MTLDNMLESLEGAVSRVARAAAQLRENLAVFRLGVKAGRSMTFEEFEAYARDPWTFAERIMRDR